MFLLIIPFRWYGFGSITGVASKFMKLTTFTCGFDMSEVSGIETNFDERRDVELMANHFKTEHYEQIINAGDLRWLQSGLSFRRFKGGNELPKLLYF